VKVTEKLSIDTAHVSLKTLAALNVMEAVAIAIAEPKLNLQRGRWSDATQYYQAADPRAG
jgi:hypothetical protein